MNFAATLKASVTGTLTGANALGNPAQPFAEMVEIAIGNGTGADQASNVFTDTRTIAASGTDALDLSGVLQNALGATIAFTAVKAIMIVADPGNINNVVVGGAGSNTFVGPFADATDKVVVGPGDVFFVTRRNATGLVVTNATGDQLLIANSSSGSSVTYTIVVVGK